MLGANGGQGGGAHTAIPVKPGEQVLIDGPDSIHIQACQLLRVIDSGNPSLTNASSLFPSRRVCPPPHKVQCRAHPIIGPQPLPFLVVLLASRHLVLLEDGQGVEGVLLPGLLLQLLEDGRQVGVILLGLGPLGLGQDLLLQAELGGAADAVDAVVVLLGVQAADGLEDRLVLLEDQVVGAVVEGNLCVRNGPKRGATSN